VNRIQTYLSFVRFSHSVFALPFALTGALLALQVGPLSGPEVLWRVSWIIIAMVAARSAAMGFNRLVDARMDALNPRTAMREIPRGAMSTREAAVFVVVASVIFVLASWRLNPLCFALSPVALAIVFWYSLAKRYTTWTQLFLGLAMAIAPVGGWLAAGGRGGWEPWLLGVAIGAWVGGFDVLYACQDIDFDRANRLSAGWDCVGQRDWQAPLAAASTKHHVLVVEIRDPREDVLPDVGDLTLVDGETGREVRVNTSSRQLRERFATAAADERASLETSLRRLGVDHVVLSTSGNWLLTLATRLRVLGPPLVGIGKELLGREDDAPRQQPLPAELGLEPTETIVHPTLRFGIDRARRVRTKQVPHAITPGSRRFSSRARPLSKTA